MTEILRVSAFTYVDLLMFWGVLLYAMYCVNFGGCTTANTTQKAKPTSEESKQLLCIMKLGFQEVDINMTAVTFGIF